MQHNMGSTCSMQRDHEIMSSRLARRRGLSGGSDTYDDIDNAARSSLRHAIVKPIPDQSITSLYPVEDNYILVAPGRRSPKSLADLATDALCRSLPYLDGELPRIPQECVNKIIDSLIKHSAINATTLRALRNNEIGSLSLAGCRGVTDEWLAPLSTTSSCSPFSSPDSSPAYLPIKSVGDSIEPMELDMDAKSGADSSLEECSSTSFLSTTSNQRSNDMCLDHEVSLSQMLPPPMVSVTANLTHLDLCGSQRLSDSGLLQLSGLHALEVARLDHCHAITGRGLQAFESSHRLHTLSLAHCRRLTDDGIIKISHLLSISNLSLEGCRCLTDQSLAAISDMVNLQKLDLSQCDLITDEGLAQLEQIDGIEELSLGWCTLLTDDGIDSLTQSSGRSRWLRVLRLARCTSITDAGVSYLRRLSALEELDLNGCRRVHSAALGDTLAALTNLQALDVSYCPGILDSNWQSKIRSLKSLELRYSKVEDYQLRRLTYLPALEELNLDSCEDISDLFLRHLPETAPNLRLLDLAEASVTDDGMEHIAKLQNLRKLSLFFCTISNRGLRHISKLSQLETLNLDSRDISDDGLRHLRHLSNLKHLDIFSARITDSGCGHLCRLQSLETLELCGGGVGDLGCSLLACLSKLTSLNLSQNERVSNRGAAALGALSELKTLNLSHTKVTGSALRFFTNLRKLKSLSLYGCEGIVGSRYLHKLQTSLPSLKCIRMDGVAEEEGMYIACRAGAFTDESLTWHYASESEMDEDSSESMDDSDRDY